MSELFQNKFFTTISGRSVQTPKFDFQQAERYIPKESASVKVQTKCFDYC